MEKKKRGPKKGREKKRTGETKEGTYFTELPFLKIGPEGGGSLERKLERGGPS